MSDPLIEKLETAVAEAWPQEPRLARLMRAAARSLSALQSDRRESTRALLALAENLECTQHKLTDLGATYVRQTLHHVTEAILLVDPHGTIREANPAAELLLGRVAPTLHGRSLTRLFATPEQAGTRTAEHELWRRLRSSRTPVTLRLAIASAATREAAVSVAPVELDGEVRLLVTLDATASEAGDLGGAGARLRRAECTLAAVTDAVFACDTRGRIEFANGAAERLLGPESLPLAGRNLAETLQLVDGRGKELALNPASLTGGPAWQSARNYELQRATGLPIPVELTVTDLDADTGNGLLLVLRDLSEQRGLRDQLEFQAAHDALTGLVNRTRFEADLAAALGQIQRGELKDCALLYLNIDQFRLINDTCGHSAGDALLLALTAAFSKRVRRCDTLARLGSDEFAVLLRGCSAGLDRELAETLRVAVAELDFCHAGQRYPQTVSVGVARIAPDCTDAGIVLSHADIACSAAKDGGRNQVHVYTPEQLPERQLEMRWVARVTRAHDDDRFLLFQQPIVPVDTMRPEAAHHELLLRMRSRSGQLIHPNAFIPAAERYNIMPRIDRWVVRRALRDLVLRPGEYGSAGNYTLAINLSGTSLSDASFLDFMREELAANPVLPGSVCFEITETAAVANLTKVAHFMHELKELGCRFALDDFGSGLSSLTYLKELPVNYLKIDGHFIRNLCVDPISREIVTAMARVSHVMGVRTVAERVETAEILSELKNIGVDFAQGYHISEPRPVVNRSVFGRRQQAELAVVCA